MLARVRIAIVRPRADPPFTPSFYPFNPSSRQRCSFPSTGNGSRKEKKQMPLTAFSCGERHIIARRASLFHAASISFSCDEHLPKVLPPAERASFQKVTQLNDIQIIRFHPGFTAWISDICVLYLQPKPFNPTSPENEIYQVITGARHNSSRRTERVGFFGPDLRQPLPPHGGTIARTAVRPYSGQIACHHHRRLMALGATDPVFRDDIAQLRATG